MTRVYVIVARDTILGITLRAALRFNDPFFMSRAEAELAMAFANWAAYRLVWDLYLD